MAVELRERGRTPYVIPYGVSNGLGAVGYASVMIEIADQAAQEEFVPTAVVLCTGSGGTQAGMVMAGSVCLPDTTIIGIDIDAEPERVHDDVVTFGKSGAALLDLPFDETQVKVIAGHAGPAYGIPHTATWDAIVLAGRLEALVLDPVYTGKALAGLISLIREGCWTKQDNVVFLHTGGTPGVFAYASQFFS